MCATKYILPPIGVQMMSLNKQMNKWYINVHQLHMNFQGYTLLACSANLGLGSLF